MGVRHAVSLVPDHEVAVSQRVGQGVPRGYKRGGCGCEMPHTTGGVLKVVLSTRDGCAAIVEGEDSL